MKQPVPRLQRGCEAVSQPIVKPYAFFQAAKQLAQRAPIDVVKELSRLVGVGFEPQALFHRASAQKQRAQFNLE